MRMASILHFIWPIPDKGLDRRIHRVQAPVLLVWGRQDLATPLVTAQGASARYGWALEVIDDCADEPPMERPEPFVAALERAIDRMEVTR